MRYQYDLAMRKGVSKDILMDDLKAVNGITMLKLTANELVNN